MYYGEITAYGSKHKYPKDIKKSDQREVVLMIKYVTSDVYLVGQKECGESVTLMYCQLRMK